MLYIWSKRIGTASLILFSLPSFLCLLKKVSALFLNINVKIIFAKNNIFVRWIALGWRYVRKFPIQKDYDLKDQIINIFGTKNETSKHRQVDISTNFANLLENYLKNNILPSYKKTQKRYVELLKDSDIPSNLYYLRHTFATNMRVMGADIKQVSYYMGHSTTAITLDVYTDIDKTLTKQKLKAIYNDLYIDFKSWHSFWHSFLTKKHNIGKHTG